MRSKEVLSSLVPRDRRTDCQGQVVAVVSHLPLGKLNLLSSHELGTKIKHFRKDILIYQAPP